MSAFIVSKAHIDTLVQAGITAGHPARGGYTLRWRVGEVEWTGAEGLSAYSAAVQQVTRECTRKTADRVGAMLWHENMTSVDHRYNDATDREVYHFTASKHTNPVTVLKALACYEYQSCEHPEWEQSEAYAFCQALRAATIHRLPGYDTAPWTIDDPAAT